MKMTRFLSILVCVASTVLAVPPKPSPVLNPPKGITPSRTRGWFPWSPKAINIPMRTWTDAERKAYEKNVEWFHESKYGVFVCFLAWGDRRNPGDSKGFFGKGRGWTSEEWNQVVDAVDVEAFADQVKELGAGYVVLTLGQWHKYACAPNPVIDELWGFEPGQYNSRRDLPMDLAKALNKRGIELMLYVMAQHQHKLPRPEGWTEQQAKDNWIKAVQWYSDHYGKVCKGWWVDGMGTVAGNSTSATRPRPMKTNKEGQDYVIRFAAALRHGNPDTLVGTGVYGLADFVHGHCIGSNWARQRTMCKPYFGQWDPDTGLQWHALMYLGSYWGSTDVRIKTDELVEYATDIVKGGGVITFDVGSYRFEDGKTIPCLQISEGQMEQLRAVRDAVKDIPPSDGSK